jgi:hypothetical protein
MTRNYATVTIKVHLQILICSIKIRAASGYLGSIKKTQHPKFAAALFQEKERVCWGSAPKYRRIDNCQRCCNVEFFAEPIQPPMFLPFYDRVYV